MRFLWEAAPVPRPSSTHSCPAAGFPRPALLSLILAPSGALGPKVAGPFRTSSTGGGAGGQPGSQACPSSVSLVQHSGESSPGGPMTLRKPLADGGSHQAEVLPFHLPSARC